MRNLIEGLRDVHYDDVSLFSMIVANDVVYKLLVAIHRIRVCESCAKKGTEDCDV